MLKAVILDIDGVVVLGFTMVKGAGPAVEQLRKKGLKIFFLSNNASRSRKSLADKLVQVGIRADPSEVYPASYALAKYVAAEKPDARVYCISTGGVEEEMQIQKIRLAKDENADVVAVGFDRQFNYGKLTIAFKAIMNGAQFLASNEDPNFPVEEGLLPGAGAMVAALQASTGRKPKIIGKPQTYMLELILKENNLKKDEVVMVGDRLDMDIGMAKKAKIKSVLVLSGIAKSHEVAKGPKPDLVLHSLADLPANLGKL